MTYARHLRPHEGKNQTLPTASHRIVVEAWEAFGDARAILHIEETSPGVSTNRVYRLQLEDGACCFAKVCSYGSFVHFRQDHERLRSWRQALRATPFADLLAEALCRDGRTFLFRDGALWVVFYRELPVCEPLPPVLPERDIEALASELARFHQACATLDPKLPPSWKSVGSDVALLRQSLEQRSWCEPRGITKLTAEFLIEHCDVFLGNIDRGGYHALPKIPVLMDWNRGNFSVKRDASGLRLFSFWDMDWFRIEPRGLDFYFLSRLVSAEGDRTAFSYDPRTLVAPRFKTFLTSYHKHNPLDTAEVDFLREACRFFLLNYTVREAEYFFQPELCERLRRETVEQQLPALGKLDLRELHELLR